MCGRYALATPSAELARFLAAENHIGDWRSRYNLAPMQEGPVLRVAGGSRVLERRRWGLVPSWARDESIASRLLNARSETAATTPAFRNAMKSRRCVVPADGFFEWQKTPGGKRPHYITRADGRVLLFAGLFEEWGGASAVRTYTILTTGANTFMQGLHDRMPVILEPEDVGTFLDPSSPTESVARLLRQAPDGVLTAHAVSTRVGNVRNDEAGLIAPVPEERGLF